GRLADVLPPGIIARVGLASILHFFLRTPNARSTSFLADSCFFLNKIRLWSSSAGSGIVLTSVANSGYIPSTRYYPDGNTKESMSYPQVLRRNGFKQNERIRTMITSNAKIGVYLKRNVSPHIDNICGESSKRNVSNDISEESPPKSTNEDLVDHEVMSFHQEVLGVRDNVEKQGGIDAFGINGFDSWHKKAYLYSHVGNFDSYHKRAFQKCENILKENQSIGDAFNKKSEIEKARYIIRLNATNSCVKLCLKTENLMRGHDESETSLSKGIFLEVYHFLRDHNEAIRTVTIENAPKNCTLTSPQIQKDVIDCFPKEIVKSICLEVGADVFSLLVDESSDVSKKEQMAIVLRYVDKYGLVKERFVGIVQVKDTFSSTLKDGIDFLFRKHGLSLKQLRGHGYDGASNMRDMMRESYKERLEKEIARGETETGKGKNQEVLHYVKEDGNTLVNRETTSGLITYFKTPDFVFYFYLLLHISGITDVLSRHFQKKDQTILEAVSLVKGTIRALKHTRASGFPSFLKKFLDMQIQEFGDRLRESSTELLENMAALSLHNSFTDFNVSNLVKLSEMYPHDFTYMERLRIPTDLAVYYQINVSKLMFTNEVVRKRFFGMKDRRGSK
nr:hypothetical protein [Tanacetum cinerariifolium]